MRDLIGVKVAVVIVAELIGFLVVLQVVDEYRNQ